MELEVPTILAIIFLGSSFFIYSLFQGIKVVKESKSVNNAGVSMEELEMLQEMYESLSSMEKRIDTLETIINDTYKENKNGKI